MIKNNVWEKGLVVGVILLFIGVSVAPGMSAVNLKMRSISKGTLLNREFQDDELVEISVSFCKTDGMQNHTFMLTKKQAEKLDILIDNFKKELDKAETMEETTALYRDMVVSLYELGLLPEDIGIEEIRQLVTGNNYVVNSTVYENIIADFIENREEILTICYEAIVYLDEHGLLPKGVSVEEAQELVAKGLRKTFNNEIISEMENASEYLFNNSNFFCLTAGDIDGALFQGPGGRIPYKLFILLLVLDYISYVVLELPEWVSELILFLAAWVLIGIYFPLHFFGGFINPIPIGYTIGIGTYVWWNPFVPTPYFVPARGWISTIGLTGKKEWTGEFYGCLPLFPNVFYIVITFLAGVAGFTGVKIFNTDTLETFFLGFALWARISYEPPSIPQNSQSTLQNSLISRQSSNPYVGVGGMNE